MLMVEIRRLTVLNALIQTILYMYTVCVHIDAMHGTCNIRLTHVPVITAGHLDSLYTELTENILRFAKVHGPYFANILQTFCLLAIFLHIVSRRDVELVAHTSPCIITQCYHAKLPWFESYIFKNDTGALNVFCVLLLYSKQVSGKMKKYKEKNCNDFSKC